MSILAFFLTLITQALALFMTRGDSKELLSCFSVLSFCFMGFLKLISLVTGHTRWRLLISLAISLEQEQMNERDYKYDYESDGEEDDSFSEHIRSYTKKFSTISIYLSRVYCFTAVVFMASPFIEYGLHLYQGTYVERYPHILPSWNPLDFSTTGYVVTILAEILSAVYCEQLSAAQVISLLQYMGATLMQLFLFCQYGDAVFAESSVGLGEGPLCSACWCLSSRIRREIAILSVGMARPCRMLAGPFNSLDLPSFIQIVRAAYSYYAVLRQTPK
ncbi:jg17420 [Pararge aegeria aegeria]|uniref:Jg17420 protein n=1 Tax=Pararge aegeria aegeria TaxID=348720 RepID=A0A8S4S0T7_9NEOP|nr:jg17420 [Pararge aegeria aegeria]